MRIMLMAHWYTVPLYLHETPGIIWTQSGERQCMTWPLNDAL